MKSQDSATGGASVSVAALVPYYRAARFIDACVASVFAQTHPPDELVIVDDEVSDESRRLLAALGDAVKVVTHPRNLGISAARNTGAQATTAQWIAFLDADDTWSPQKLERQLQFIEDHPQVAAVHTGMRVFSGDRTIAEYTDKPAFLTIADTLMMSAALPSSLMIRRDALDAVGGWRDKAGSEDRDLCLRLLAAGYSIGFVPEALVNFRREGHGNASGDGHRSLLRHLRLYRCHWRLFLEHGKTRAYLEWTFDHAAHRSRGLYRLVFKSLALVFSTAQGRLWPRAPSPAPGP